MATKAWSSVVDPREDLCERRAMDMAEFAVHLGHVRDGNAHQDYQEPRRFFEQTYLTRDLTALAAEALRRMSGEITEASAVFSLMTQFGGGKTHALTLLYHLAEHGREAHAWRGVPELMRAAHVDSVPRAETAIFVGTEFDSLTGRGGDDGTPRRTTPWGEIAYQLGGEEAFTHVATHEDKGRAPAEDVIRKILPTDKPCIILMDEVMNYISQTRGTTQSGQFYHFLQNLSETARGQKGVVLVVSLPRSEGEVAAEDIADYKRLQHLLDRLAKTVMVSAEAETAEIIRRRLFDWGGLPQAGRKAATEYAAWLLDHRTHLPQSFPFDHAQKAFEDAYPFHPCALSVFERKWQALPSFQRTRGVLRMLALWVAHAYSQPPNKQEPIISMGSAPLDDPAFRSAVSEQLGTEQLEPAITTDICGKPDAHAVRLDEEAPDTIRKAQLHRKVATAIFFESNGGQTQDYATLPEVRLAVSSPDLDVANVEMAIEALAPPNGACYYLHARRNQFWFSVKPTLTKMLADRIAMIKDEAVDERVRAEVQGVFGKAEGVQIVHFPERSSDIPDRPALTFAVLAPSRSRVGGSEPEVLAKSMTMEYGASGRTFKSALMWCLPEDETPMAQEARKLLAWEELRDEAGSSNLDEAQKAEVSQGLKRSERDLTESVWRAYKNVLMLDETNEMRLLDMGLINSSAASNIVRLIVNHLKQEDTLEEKGISPDYLVRHWPPAFAETEWSTKAVRDAFFSSPQLPRLMNGDAIKETIARGVQEARLAYVGKSPAGGYDPLLFKQTVLPQHIEISDDMYVITAERARQFIEPPKLTSLQMWPEHVVLKPGAKQTFVAKGIDQHGAELALGELKWSADGGTIDSAGAFEAGDATGQFAVTVSAGDVSATADVTVARAPAPPPPSLPGKVAWTGQVPPQKWMTFYTKVLAKFANSPNLKITVGFSIEGDEALTGQAAEETQAALRELGLEGETGPGATAQ